MDSAEANIPTLMPDDRFLHPRLRRSKKVSTLSWLERCVWEDMLLGADDFGVLPDKAAKIRADNDAFERCESESMIRSSMDAVIKVGLFLSFEHQGEPYLCDPVWQDFQHVRWPRKTLYPMPPEAILLKSSPKTLRLFSQHDGWSQIVNSSIVLRKHFRSISGVLLSDKVDRSMANTNGLLSVPKEGKEVKEKGEKIGVRKSIDTYHDLFVAKFKRKPKIDGGKDGALMKKLLALCDGEPDELDALLKKFFASPDPFIQKSGYTIGVFSACFNKLITEAAGKQDRRRVNQEWEGRKSGKTQL